MKTNGWDFAASCSKCQDLTRGGKSSQRLCSSKSIYIYT